MGLIRKIKESLFGRKDVIEWNHEFNPGLMWRIPDLGSPREVERDIRKVEGFIVKPYEMAIVVREGALHAVLGPGHYLLEKEAKRPGTEIIFFSKKEWKVKWGLSKNPAEGAYIRGAGFFAGAAGFAYVKVEDPAKLITSLIEARRSIEVEALEEIIKGILKSAAREALQMYEDASTLLSSRAEIEKIMKDLATKELSRWGLSLASVEVHSIAIPEEIEEVVQLEAKRKYLESKYELEKLRELSELELDRIRAERAYIAEKPKLLVERERKMIEADYYRRLREGGIDVVEFEVARTAPVKEFKVEKKITPAAAAISMDRISELLAERDRVKKLIEKLDEKFLNDEITAEQYNSLMRRLQERLNEINRKLEEAGYGG